MIDNNATDTTEDGQRKQVHSENRIRSPSLMGSDKDQGEVDTGNSLKGVSQKRKRGRSATKHKKATKKIIQKQHSKSKRRYRSTSSSSLTEEFSPSLKRHKSRRKKRKHHKLSSYSSYSSSPSSSPKSSETRSIEGTLGSRFQVTSEEDKFRCNLPTDMAEYANTHFEIYVKETDLK